MFKTFESCGKRTSWFRIFVAVLILPLSLLFSVLVFLADKIIYLDGKCYETIENFIRKFEE